MTDRLVFVVPPEHGIGFELAGAEVYRESNPKTAARLIVQLVKDPSIGLIAIPDRFYQALSPSFLKRLETKGKPVLIQIPLARFVAEPTEETFYVREAIKRATGFYLNIDMGGRRG